MNGFLWDILRTKLHAFLGLRVPESVAVSGASLGDFGHNILGVKTNLLTWTLDSFLTHSVRGTGKDLKMKIATWCFPYKF